MTTTGDRQCRQTRVRVAHVIHSLGPGGAEDVLVTFARFAPAAMIGTTVVALSPPDREAGHTDALRAAGADVVELGLHRWDPRGVPRLARLLRERGIDIVHTHLKHADVVGGLAARRAGLPSVSTLHLIERTATRPLARFKRAAGLQVRARVAARVIALSTAQADWYRRYARRTVPEPVVLPNGAPDPVRDLPGRDGVRRSLGIGPGRTLAVCASLMRPEKGHHLLLDALRLVPAEVDLVVALAGDGPLAGEIGRRVEQDPLLRGRVRLLGYRSDVPALLAASDLVIHPSLEDALPTTLILALGTGRPVVATSVGGIPDIVAPGCGVLTPCSAPALAEAIGRTATDAGLRRTLGARGRQRFLERYDAPVWVAGLRRLYDGLA